MVLSVDELGVLVFAIEATIIVLILRTRRLVTNLLAMVTPWLTMDPTEGGEATGEAEPARRAVRDSRGRFQRWETVPSGAVRGGEVPGALPAGLDVSELAAQGVAGVPSEVISELADMYSKGTLDRKTLIAKAGPHLPRILAALKSEFSPGAPSSGSGDTHSRW